MSWTRSPQLSHSEKSENQICHLLDPRKYATEDGGISGEHLYEQR